MAEKTILLGTDVAAFVLFHPDDLAHRAQDPLDWYSYDFAYGRESAAGRLIAFCTGSDGGYAIRLTTRDLTPAEAADACPSWSFPLIVRHGRILLDNTDALPSDEQMRDLSSIGDRWFELGNGAYRVTVHPIECPDPANSAREAGTISPNYVIQFQPVGDITGIPVAPTPPDIRPDRDWTPRLLDNAANEEFYRWPEARQGSTNYPSLAVPDTMALLPRQFARLCVGDEIAEAAFPKTMKRAARAEGFVVAPSFESGAYAILARQSQLSWRDDRKAMLGISGLCLVRVVRGGPAASLKPVEIAPVEKPDMTLDPEAAEDLRARLIMRVNGNPAFQARLDHPSFETERLAALISPEAITTWALMHLDLPFAIRVKGYASPVARRMRMLHDLLATGAPPSAPPPASGLMNWRHKGVWAN
ncbi:DUF6386 family protein [Labrys okinawensis]|uniref:DUF6386 family protein n=1 Tax=Labrys okinawensis TaxID=346911 RepID=UPI0039BD602F